MDDKRLTMLHFLERVKAHGIDAKEILIDDGFHPNVIYGKAEKAARRQYYEYGTIADRGWLLPAGIRFIGDALNKDIL